MWVWYMVLRLLGRQKMNRGAHQSHARSYVTRRNNVRRNEKWSLDDSFLAASTIGMLVYKFWPVLLQPSLLWNKGVGVFFFAGGPYVQLGVFFAFLGRLWWDAHRHGIQLSFLARRLLTGFLPALSISSLLVKEYGTTSFLPFGYELQGETVHPINLYLLVFLLPWLAVFGWRRTFSEEWFLFSFCAFLILLQPIRLRDDFFFLLHGMGWAWGGLLLSGLWIILEKRADSRWSKPR